MNEASVGIVIGSARKMARQVKNCLESLLVNTQDVPYRLIWHHVNHDEATTNYLIEQYQQKKIPHLFLHQVEDDWWVVNNQNLAHHVYSLNMRPRGPLPVDWIVTVCGDMQFEPGWLSHTLAVVELFKDLPIGAWSPYRPPEHTGTHPPQERDGKFLWLYNSIAPRCMMIKRELFMQMGFYDPGVDGTADWKMVRQMKDLGLKFGVIGGNKVIHADWGYCPAHWGAGDYPEMMHSDEKQLQEYGGYRGDPGTHWPPELGQQWQ